MKYETLQERRFLVPEVQEEQIAPIAIPLFPRATSQVAMLAWIFGDCREGQSPRCKQRGL